MSREMQVPGACHIAALGMVLALSLAGTAGAQVAGVRRLGATTTETEQVIAGWSAKQSILGRTVYNAAGDRLGKALDLIVDTDKRVSLLIIDTSGPVDLVGASRHLIAVPVAQLQVHGGRLLLPDADRQALASQPAFVHAPVTRTQSSIVERAQQDVDRARKTIAQLERMSAHSSGDARANLERQILSLRQDQQAVEDKMAEMEAADATQWQAVEAEVGRASARLRNAIRNAPT